MGMHLSASIVVPKSFLVQGREAIPRSLFVIVKLLPLPLQSYMLRWMTKDQTANFSFFHHTSLVFLFLALKLSTRTSFSDLASCLLTARCYEIHDIQIADVWSCGVTLYVMLVGSYPFEDPEDPRDFRKTVSQILSVQYSIPDYVRVSQGCRQLLSQIFVADPSKRITIPEIKKQAWFQKNLPKEIIEVERTNYIVREQDWPSQSVEEIMHIILEAKKPAEGSKAGDLYANDAEANADTEEVDSSGDFLAPFD